jgi:hypothetical protein
MHFGVLGQTGKAFFKGDVVIMSQVGVYLWKFWIRSTRVYALLDWDWSDGWNLLMDLLTGRGGTCTRDFKIFG